MNTRLRVRILVSVNSSQIGERIAVTVAEKASR